MLASRFEVKDMGLLHYFVGVKIVQDRAKGSVWIGQPAYAATLLERFGMENAKSVTTPVSCGLQLVKARDSDKVLIRRCTNQLLDACCIYLQGLDRI